MTIEALANVSEDEFLAKIGSLSKPQCDGWPADYA
jgi:hypothetical protein